MANTVLETPPAASLGVACPDCGQALGCVNVLYPHFGYCFGCHDWRPASPEARPEWHPNAINKRRHLAWLATLDYLAAERQCRAKGA